MRIAIIYLMLCLSVSAQTSNVQRVKAWIRTHVMGVPGGTLRDPTGTIADAQRYEAVAASVIESSNLVTAAASGLTNALERLYAVTNQVAEFTHRIYLAADMEEDPGYLNVWSAVMGERADPDGTVHYYCHYSRVLSAPPQTRWCFDVATGVHLWADGSVATNNVTIDYHGYDCYDIAVKPPATAAGVVLRANKFMKIGTPDTPLDIDDAGIFLTVAGVGTEAFTGPVVFTNILGAVSNCITETYLAGTLYQITTNSIGGGQ